jgi:uncharacterized membrane protein
MNLHPAIPAFLFLEFSRTAFSMSIAGLILLPIAAWTAKESVARSQGLDKIVALANLAFAIPLAIFGAEHLSAAQFIQLAIPSYIPWHLFWAYFVGFALIAASLSIATKIGVRWSALLFGIMMLVFEATLHIPRAVANPSDRFAWTVVVREFSFTGGGWLLAAHAMPANRQGGKKFLIVIGRTLVALAAIFFGIEHFLHPLGAPGVPLEKIMPTWIPVRPFIGYLTGTILSVSGIFMLLARKARTAAASLGSWILLLVLFIYVPILITSLLNPSTEIKVEGLNYFGDTLLFGGAILASANATAAED